jgi:hypothetical protein
MKKYLMTGIAAIAMCAAFTSCSKDPGFEQTTPEQIAQAQYDAAFIKAFGQPAANQDWGFGSRSITRSAGDPEVVKKDVWENFPDKLDGNAVPADVTTAEAAYVYAWFQKEENKGLTEEGQPWTNFFLQQVYGTMDKQKKGIWHRYDQNRVNNGYDSNYYDEEFTDKGGMDYLTVGDGTTMTHVLDFNAEEGGPWGIVYMKNSSAMQFGYHGSWDSSDRQLFKLAQITVPGECFGEGEADRTAWYVGLSLLAEKDDNGKKVLGEQRKDWGDDWILKVVPGVSKPNYRVIAEDLNASEKTDFDFNDVVFDVIPNEAKTAAKIVLRAAGGIYKLTVAGSEVHEAFAAAYPDAGYGVGANGLYPMINTNPWNPEIKVTLFENYEGDFSDASIRNTIRNIEIRVYKPGFEDSGVELTATTGKPACKILVDDTFSVVTERQDISNEYGNFTSWVQGYFADDFWWKSGTAE